MQSFKNLLHYLLYPTIPVGKFSNDEVTFFSVRGFWAQLVEDPSRLLDIDVPEVMRGSCSLIASTIDDVTTGRANHNKLLYDVTECNEKLVEELYTRVGTISNVSDEEINKHMNVLSCQISGEFNKISALEELYTNYIEKYRHTVSSTSTYTIDLIYIQFLTANQTF